MGAAAAAGNRAGSDARVPQRTKSLSVLSVDPRSRPMTETGRDSSPHTSVQITALPLDLLGLVFRSLDNLALLHLVSLVCKRWRRVALPFITKLKLSPITIFKPIGPATLAQLSGLTSVHIWANFIVTFPLR